MNTSRYCKKTRREGRERERERERERASGREGEGEGEGERERVLTPIGKLIGDKSIEFVHDENEDQLDASSSDSYYDIANCWSKGESIDRGIDEPSHSQTIQQHRQHNTQDNDDLCIYAYMYVYKRSRHAWHTNKG